MKIFIRLGLTLDFLISMVLLIEAQNIVGKSNTLIQFDLTVNDEILDALDPSNPRSEREKEDLTKTKYLLVELLYEKAFKMLEAKLKDMSVDLEPVSILTTHEIEYNDYEFPDVVTPKAVIKNLQKNGYKTDFYLSFKTTFNKASDIFGSGKLIKQFKLDTKIAGTLFDSAGRILKQIKGSTPGDQLIRAKDFPGKKFDKMEPEYMELLVENLIPALDEAMDKMLKDLSTN